MRRLKWIVPLVVVISLLISSVAFAAPAQPQYGGYWYSVRWGDTLFSIGRATGANPWAIANANGIGAPYTIYPGQPLWIPAYNPWPNPNPYPYGCGYWRAVYFGDTLYSIASAAGVSPWAIARANGLYNLNIIYAGRSLWIPCAYYQPYQSGYGTY